MTVVGMEEVKGTTVGEIMTGIKGMTNDIGARPARYQCWLDRQMALGWIKEAIK
jgi:hypothetical protein